MKDTFYEKKLHDPTFLKRIFSVLFIIHNYNSEASFVKNI